MNAPAGTTLTERTEWVFGLSEPKPPSRFWLASFPAFVPLWMGCYTLWFWSISSRLGFAVM